VSKWTHFCIYANTKANLQALPVDIWLFGAVAQLIEALRYKPESRGFHSRRRHCNFSLTQPFRPHYGPGVDSASNRNEYQEYFLRGKGGRFVGLTTLPPSCAECLQTELHRVLRATFTFYPVLCVGSYTEKVHNGSRTRSDITCHYEIHKMY
jgi:hypothetical protein